MHRSGLSPSSSTSRHTRRRRAQRCGRPHGASRGATRPANPSSPRCTAVTPVSSPQSNQSTTKRVTELFTDQGFAATTVPQITARAGLTTRTFFRHFADKREVLFAHEQDLPALVAQLMADAPASLEPLALVEDGLQLVAATRFEGRHAHLRAHRSVVEADEGLRERGLRKSAVLTDAIRRGFLDRGLDDVSAALTAHTAVTVMTVAVDQWLDGDAEVPFAVVLRETFATLRSVIGGSALPGAEEVL